MSRRVLFVARTRYRLPLDETLQRRFDALGRVLEWRQLACAAGGRAHRDESFVLLPAFPLRRLDGVAFHLLLPFHVARELRRYEPDAVIVQGAHEAALALAGRALARSRARVIVDVHGDWRTATRVYGSRRRGLLSPLADRVARWAVRHADGVRTVSGFTTGLVRAEGVEPTSEFPAYMDLALFLDRPPAALPEVPTALFVGVLERYKGLDVLSSAWPGIAARVPGARLELVGRGSLRDVARVLAARDDTDWREAVDAAGVARALDAATLLVLPSRREGMGRVVVEAFCRGRAVVGTASGGIPDLVEHGRSGLLVAPDDAAALADALVRVLGDRVLAERLGAGACEAAGRWVASAEEWAARTGELVERVLVR
jgi:glycosyltransferase involved in cell wall biosynthesis